MPTGPEVGERLVICGTTVKLELLLETPLTVTITLAEPGDKLLGTVATMLVALQLEVVADVPPIDTVLEPCVDPKFAPVIVIEVPTIPEVGEMLVMLGAGTTVKLAPLLDRVPTVTTTLPVVAPVGTRATMDVELQFVGVAAVPLNLIVLLPCVVPKLTPVIVIDAPTAPEVGDRLLMLGATVKLTPLLAVPLTVTTTLPVVAPLGTGATIFVLLQLVGVAVVPLNLIVLVPCFDPKPDPLMVTDAPTAPDVGERELMLGPAANEATGSRTHAINGPAMFQNLTLKAVLRSISALTKASLLCEEREERAPAMH